MKLNRLLSITTILLNRRSVTAAALAERFGVSVRTIYRDIDDLSASGVPGVAMPGQGGGIAILEGYALSRAALSPEERDSLLLALKTLQVTRHPQAQAVLEKMGALFQSGGGCDWIAIDFSLWGSDPNASGKFDCLREAILREQVLEIEYLDAQNHPSRRRVEPLRLVFQFRSWYLWAYCALRQDYRSFRISRIRALRSLAEHFDREQRLLEAERLRRQELQKQAAAQSAPPPGMAHLRLRFTAAALHRLYDDYDDAQIRETEDGFYELTLDFPEDEWVYGYLLSFGDALEVLSPPHIRDILRQRCENIAAQYRIVDKQASGLPAYTEREQETKRETANTR